MTTFLGSYEYKKNIQKLLILILFILNRQGSNQMTGAKRSANRKSWPTGLVG